MKLKISNAKLATKIVNILINKYKLISLSLLKGANKYWLLLKDYNYSVTDADKYLSEYEHTIFIIYSKIF